MDYSKEVSIIIPTYNRVELLEFTLLSLYKQNFPINKFEVIVVNDCSTDGTKNFLNDLNPPFDLVVINNKKNQGAAYSRNQGIKKAQGKLLIFLDEMLVDRNFIQSHLKYHVQENMVITTHFNGQRIFTHYYENFSGKQKRLFKKTTLNLTSKKQVTIKKGVKRLIQPKKILNQEFMSYGLESKVISKWYTALQAQYGMYLQRMAAPWYTFVTNGVSLSKALIEEAGLFDENFKGAWMEDWELGLRLHQKGAIFYNAPDITCYHQNHPIGRDIKGTLINCLYFGEKYPFPEVMLIPTLSTSFKWTVESLGKTLTQFRQLERKDEDHYSQLLKAFKELILIFKLYILDIVMDANLPLLTDFQQGFVRWNPHFAPKVKEQLRRLEQEDYLSSNYSYFIKGFKDLLRLPIKNSKGVFYEKALYSGGL